MQLIAHLMPKPGQEQVLAQKMAALTASCPDASRLLLANGDVAMLIDTVSVDHGPEGIAWRRESGPQAGRSKSCDLLRAAARRPPIVLACATARGWRNQVHGRLPLTFPQL